MQPATGPPLDSASRDLSKALQVWERLVALTDGLYPERDGLRTG